MCQPVQPVRPFGRYCPFVQNLSGLRRPLACLPVAAFFWVFLRTTHHPHRQRQASLRVNRSIPFPRPIHSPTAVIIDLSGAIENVHTCMPLKMRLQGSIPDPDVSWNFFLGKEGKGAKKPSLKRTFPCWMRRSNRCPIVWNEEEGVSRCTSTTWREELGSGFKSIT